MTQLVPSWRHSSVADHGMAVMELEAYVCDQLSYQQDAIATEAYLDTARQRISLRRHALLVDYPMHDGCNARAWLQIEVAPGSHAFDQTKTQFLTRCTGLPTGITAASEALQNAMRLRPLVFEPLHGPKLHFANNRISFYTWSNTRCCLPRGATRATLAGALPDLAVNDALLFEEVLGPNTGVPEDADPTHRHVVRLTSVVAGSDLLNSAPITEIAWAPEDALPFPLCISAVTDEAHESKQIGDVSVARGNLVLVDHGATMKGEDLGVVPPPSLFIPPADGCDHCEPGEAKPIPVRYRPQLAQAPLTQAATVLVKTAGAGGAKKRLPFDPAAPAADAMNWSMADVYPQISLDSMLMGKPKHWQAVRTLLNSARAATEFVVEIDDDGVAHCRFGDDEHGQRPETDMLYTANYRIGNGSIGNVGAESIAHIVGAPADISNIRMVRNPLPASGGLDPESHDSVRRNAPEAFRRQERAVTLDDYAAVTERHKGVQRAAATMRWTGSWHTVFMTIDPESTADPTPLKPDLAVFVDRYRMAGHDLEFNDPRYVPLELELHVCVEPDYFRSTVKQSLMDVFTDRVLPDGRRGLFHPDNVTFGQTVYLSQIYAAAHAVPGVASASVTKFQHQGTTESKYLAQGQMPLRRLEIARLANSLNFPERGVLRLDIRGGK